MKITWLGHGSFRIEIGGQVLLLAPWLTGNPMLPEVSHDAAVAGATHILLTHAHFDHVADTLDLARKLGVPLLGALPIDLEPRLAGDSGTPVASGEGAMAQAFAQIAQGLIKGGMA